MQGGNSTESQERRMPHERINALEKRAKSGLAELLHSPGEEPGRKGYTQNTTTATKVR